MRTTLLFVFFPAVAFFCSAFPAVAGPVMVDVKRTPGDKEWKKYETRTVASAAAYQVRSQPQQLDVYGGDPARKDSKTGFFYTKNIDGRWWLVDPEGNLFIHVAVCSVTPSIGSEKAKKAFNNLFGSEEKWADATAAMLRTNGFNGTGSWSKDTLLSKAAKRLVYCPNWNFMSSYGKKRGGISQQSGHAGYPNDAIFVFDPEFETFAMEHAKQLEATKNDPWLLGHFSDNEMPLTIKCLDKFLGLPKNDSGYRAAKAWFDSRKGGKTDAKITNDDREAFRGFVAERYFSIVAKAIKAHDPNHLHLGSRFHGDEKSSEAVFRATGKYVDIISVNHYRTWTPDAGLLANWVKWSGKPYMITEFYAKGVDSGMPNNTGAGWLVKTQKDRGLFYQNFCLSLLESKGCVGWSYFKYADNDMENKNVDPSNLDSNKGIVSAYSEPYAEYLSVMKELNINVYGLIGWMDKGGKVHR